MPNSPNPGWIDQGVDDGSLGIGDRNTSTASPDRYRAGEPRLWNPNNAEFGCADSQFRRSYGAARNEEGRTEELLSECPVLNCGPSADVAGCKQLDGQNPRILDSSSGCRPAFEWEDEVQPRTEAAQPSTPRVATKKSGGSFGADLEHVGCQGHVDDSGVSLARQ